MTPGQAKAGVPAPSPEGSDDYDTPAEATRALLRRESFPPLVWEPAAGVGLMAAVLRAEGHTVIESDREHIPTRTRPIDATADFLLMDAPLGGARCVITNPPFSKLTDFMRHCMRLDLDKWALLIPLPALSGWNRFVECYRVHPPQIVHVFSRRIPFRRRGYEGKLAPLGMHAWAVWDRWKPVSTGLGWIDEEITP